MVQVQYEQEILTQEVDVLQGYESQISILTEPEETVEIVKDSKYIDEFWKLEENRLILSWEDEEIYFEMPEDWKIEETHEDLLRLAHYVMTSPWDKSLFGGLGNVKKNLAGDRACILRRS